MNDKIEIVCWKCKNTIAEIEFYEPHAGIKHITGVNTKTSYNEALKEITSELITCAACQEKELEEREALGFEAGYEEGNSTGYDQGYEDGKEACE